MQLLWKSCIYASDPLKRYLSKNDTLATRASKVKKRKIGNKLLYFIGSGNWGSKITRVDPFKDPKSFLSFHRVKDVENLETTKLSEYCFKFAGILSIVELLHDSKMVLDIWEFCVLIFFKENYQFLLKRNESGKLISKIEFIL